MKKINIIALVMLLAFGMNAQNNVIDKHFSSYAEKDNYVDVNISGSMFKLLAHLESDDAEMDEMKETFEKIEKFRLIAGHQITNAKSKYTSAVSEIENDYEELMNFTSKEGNATIFIDEYDGVVQELVIVGTGHDNFAVVSIWGEFDLKEIGKVIKKVSETQKEHFKMDVDFDDAKVYPNPSNKMMKVDVVVPDSYIGGEWTLFDMNSKTVMVRTNVTKEERMDTKDLASGTYFLLIQKGEKSIRKKIVIQ